MILTYKYRIKDKSARKVLADYAYAVNQVWNYCNGFQKDLEARYQAGAPKRKWPSHFDLTKLTSCTSKDLGIHAQTISEVCRQFSVSRDKAKHSLRFRSSGGPRRALGWIPFQTQSRQITGNALTYLGKTFHVFGVKRRPIPETAKGGAFVEDARGRWWLTLHVEVEERTQAAQGEIGVDLGLHSLATLSTGEKLKHPRVLGRFATSLATAQRARKKNRVQAIHQKIANVRKDYLHKITSGLVKKNRLIVVGDVSHDQMPYRSMAKAALDAGWSGFRSQLRYKCQQAGVEFVVLDERLTTLTCSRCSAPSGPEGIPGLGIRRWKCQNCGDTHDRDVNAALNILAAGRSAPPLVEGSREGACCG